MDGDVIPALLGLLILALIISVAWKAKEQVQFDNLVDEEKTLKDYRLLAQRFRSD
jgi:L-lactate permease